MTFPQAPEHHTQPPASQQYAPPPGLTATPSNAKGLALTALIVGIVSFLLGLVPVLGIILGLVGVGFGVFALVKRQPKGLALTGTILAGCAIVASIATTAGLGAAVDSLPKETAKVAEEIEEPVVEEKQEPVEEKAAEPAEEPKPAEPEVSAEFRSALSKAQTYSDMMHMSKAGLYDQLTSEFGEKFSAEAAQYAVDNVEADWNYNALQKAISYQDTMSMSPEAIRDQLTSDFGEKFTQEEADYAVANLPQ